MEIVVDLENEVVNRILNEGLGKFKKSELEKVSKAICSGTVLPEGHGNLKDIDLIQATVDGKYYFEMQQNLDKADIVVKADKKFRETNNKELLERLLSQQSGVVKTSKLSADRPNLYRKRV